MTTSPDMLPNGSQAVLPHGNGGLRRASVLDEDQRPLRFKTRLISASAFAGLGIEQSVQVTTAESIVPLSTGSFSSADCRRRSTVTEAAAILREASR
jgi:hypothetical protein